MKTLFDDVTYSHGGNLYREVWRGELVLVWCKSRYRTGDWRAFTWSIEDWEDFVRHPNTRIAKGDLQASV